jgi:hypothetical protein
LANTYSTAVAATSNVCVTCAANMQSGVGSDESTDCKCNKGYTGNDGTTCSACEAGKYKTVVGASNCLNCNEDMYLDFTGATTSTSCRNCPQYSQAPEGSSSLAACVCKLGYTGAGGGPGHVPLPGFQNCRACPSGTFKDTTGSAPCTNCEENHYQPDGAKTSPTDCKTCGPNSLSSIGNALQASCQCAPGYTGPNGEACVECFAGKFKPNKGAQPCDLCRNGTYSGRTAQTSDATCDACPDNSRSWMGSTARSDCHCEFGYYTNRIGQADSSCTKCAVGTFNDRLNQETCSKCPAGTFSNVETATSVETCQICTVGFSADGQSQCDACPGNSSTLEPGGKVLQDCKCNKGYTGDDGGTCEHCAAGKYKDDEGSAACTNCPKDTYSPEVANVFDSDCNNCDVNAEAPEGSDSRDDCKCKLGWTSKIPGIDGEMCEACVPGKFKDKLGYDACTNCPEDKYLPSSASTSVSQCINCHDYSHSDPGSDSEEDCLCLSGRERSV